MPPISRTDFPYPLRTIDGEIDVIADSVLTESLDVTGTATIGELYVSGFTTVVGGIIDLADIECNTINCNSTATFDTTLSVGGISSLNGGVQTTSITASGTVAALNLSASNNLTAANSSIGVSTATSLLASGQLKTTDTTNSFSTITGSIVTSGGLGVDKNIFAGGSVAAVGAVVGNSLQAVATSGTTLTIASTDDSTNSTSGSLITQGGITAIKNVWAGGSLTVGTSISANGTTGGISTESTDDSVSPTTGSIKTKGGIGAVKNIVAGGVIQSEIAQNATSTSTGALRALNGGISCALDIVAGGTVTAGAVVSNGDITGTNVTANSVKVDSTTPKTALNVAAGDLRINGAGEFANVTITNLTNLNNKAFVFDQGYFTPQLKSLKQPTVGDTNLIIADWAGVSGIDFYQQGYYQRIGNVVHVWYNCQSQITGAGNDPSQGFRTPVITGLPYPCRLSLLNKSQETTWPVSDPSFPNGYALGIGTPGVPLMPYPYEATVLTQAFPFDPQVPPLYPSDIGTWTPDGTTITFASNQLSAFPIAGVVWENPGNIYNVHIVAGTYTLRFNGYVSYFCDL